MLIKRTLFIKDTKKRDSGSKRGMLFICNGIKFEEYGKVPFLDKYFAALLNYRF